MLPLLRLIWLMLLPCGDVVTTVRNYLADVLPMLWLLLLPLCLILWQMLCHYWCTIDMVVAEGIVVQVADVIATSKL